MQVINKINELYNQCVPISQITCDTIDYKIFKNYPLTRFCNSKELLKYIPTGDDKDIDGFNGFIYDNPYFWLLPVTTTNKICGFVIKSYHQKQYRNIFCKNHIVSFFGFHNFSNFKFNMPIILCEGTKDQIILSKIYPYTLACLTVGLSQDGLKAINHLTKNILLVYDNDKPGRDAVNRDKDTLIKLGCKVMSPYYIGHDAGDLYNNPMGFDILKNSITTCLNQLY